jgi:bifunctional DNase/RNase
MIEAVVESIRVSLVTQQRVVVLKELNGERHLPIWIGPFEAEAIAMEMQGVAARRPLPYDLLKTVIHDLGGRVNRIEVTDLSDEVFFAKIVIELQGRQLPIDSRPSDAIALGVRAKVPIMVANSVMDRAGVELGREEEEEESLAEAAEGVPSAPINEEKLSAFRDFINSLDIDDLGKNTKTKD